MVKARGGRSAARPHVVVLFFAILAVVGLLTVLPKAQSWADMSRMGTIQALVEHHTLAIDRTVFATTGDKVYVRGHLYSDKLVTPALFGALVYWPVHAMGLSLRLGFSWAYYIIDVVVMKGFWLLGLFAFFRALRWTGISDRWRLILTAALGVGSTFLSWTATFNNHALTASWVMIAFALLLRARHRPGARWPIIGSGLFLGLAGGSDMPMMAFAAVLFLYVVAIPELRRGAVWYALGVVVAILPAFVATYMISGSLVPVQLVPAYFIFPGSSWTVAKLTGSHVNSVQFLQTYTRRGLVGERGFLSYNPLSYLAIGLMLWEIVRRRRFWPEALVVLTSSVVVIGYYLAVSNNYGGYSYSMRWFVPLLPLWFFFLYPVGEAGRRLLVGMLFWVLFAAGTVSALVGCINPWSDMGLSGSPFLANLRIAPQLWKEFVSGGIH